MRVGADDKLGGPLRYVDSASRSLADTMHGWLAQHMPSATQFACQTGYFRFDALEPHATDIRRMLDAGGRFDLVVGLNEDRIIASDLEDTLAIINPWMPATASFTLVGASNGLFHPKTYYAALSGGRQVAAVGSANLTLPGVGHHVEACVFLDDAEDDAAVIDAIRSAIVAWRERAMTGSEDARQVSSDLISEFAAERVIDPAALPSRTRRSRGSRSHFPPLMPIEGAPQRSRSPRPKKAPPIRQLSGAPSEFPAGMVGVVKRLSRTDVKGFEARPGTPYVALPPNPAEFAARLPLKPQGVHDEPRLDCIVEARLDCDLFEVAYSGTDVASIIHVGMGKTQRSNVDLRMNLPHSLHDKLLQVAFRSKVNPPSEGDAAAIEFLDSGRVVRLTIASGEPMKAVLLELCGEKRWGWLPAGVTPPW